MDKKNEEFRKTYFEHYRMKRSVEFVNQYDGRKSWQGLQGRIKVRRSRRMVWGVSVAAAVVVLLVSVTYLLSVRDSGSRGVPKVIAETSFPEKGSKKAILTLANGELVDLSRQSGRVGGEREEVVIDNTDQQLVYQSVKSLTKDLKYNTLFVPRSGEYQLLLSDGTKVWINAESSLRYPEVFGDKREVVLNGEAYFEVARDAERPFVVKVVSGFEVKVLGTHFNIKAYETDENYETTLVEGKVQVSRPDGERVVLKPTEQMVIGRDGKQEVRVVNTAYYTAWHKGWFYFDDESLEQVLEMIGRWYDIGFEFSDDDLKELSVTGKVKRFENLNVILEMLTKTTRLHFDVKDKIVTVRKTNNRE